MEPIETVTIPKSEYLELLKSDIMLAALEDGGVDNWDWYGDAQEAAADATDGDPRILALITPASN